MSSSEEQPQSDPILKGKITQLIRAYEESQRSSENIPKVGTLGLLYEVSVATSKSAKSQLSHDKAFEFAFFACNSLLKKSDSLKLGPISKKCFQWIRDAMTQIKNETLFPESRTKCLRLLFEMERVVIEWEFHVDKIAELVRLGDRFLKACMWSQAEEAYREGTELLIETTIESFTEMHGLSRMAVLGLAYALFGQEKFEECGKYLRLGLQYFPQFPTMPFDPKKLYLSNEPLLHNTLKNLEAACDQDKGNLLLQFVLGFQYHFINKKEEAKKIFSHLDKFEESKMFLQLYPKDEKTNNANNGYSSEYPLEKIEKIVQAMIQPGTGVEIKNRKYRFRTYEQCFIGSEAVTWISMHIGCTRDQAVQFGQRLLSMFIIRHVTGEHNFDDQNLFFEFQQPILEFCFQPILQKGHLYVKGSKQGKWIKRLAVLYKTGLACFDDSVDHKVKGGKLTRIFRLTKSKFFVSTISIEKKYSTFTITIDSDIEVHLAADNYTEAHKWVTSLQQVDN